jgi:DNA-binding MarR family transcriptional regulator
MFSRMTSPAVLTALADRLIQRRLTAALSPLGLSPAGFMVLVDLAGGHKRTQSALAARLGVEQPTMSNTLQRMERDGLVSRVRRVGDGRSFDVLATSRAEALYPSAVKAVQSVSDAAARGLTTEERLRFIGTLARVIENLEQP